MDYRMYQKITSGHLCSGEILVNHPEKSVTRSKFLQCVGVVFVWRLLVNLPGPITIRCSCLTK